MTHRILLADDSVTIRKVVELTFSDEDFTIDAVGDGAQAFEHARAQRPDIIISDVIMPGLNGYELCQQIKTDPGLQSVPFLFLKGTFESFDEEKARSCGADGFIVKPFESQEMIAKVRKLIERAALAPPVAATQPPPRAAAPVAPLAPMAPMAPMAPAPRPAAARPTPIATAAPAAGQGAPFAPAQTAPVRPAATPLRPQAPVAPRPVPVSTAPAAAPTPAPRPGIAAPRPVSPPGAPPRPATAPPPIPTVQTRQAPTLPAIPVMPARPAPPIPQRPTRPVAFTPPAAPPPLQSTPPIHKPPPQPPPPPPPPPPPIKAVHDPVEDFGFDFGESEGDRFSALASQQATHEAAVTSSEPSGESDEDLWSEVSLRGNAGDLLGSRTPDGSGSRPGADIIELAEEEAITTSDVLFDDEAEFEEAATASGAPLVAPVEPPAAREETPVTIEPAPASIPEPAAPISVDQAEIERIVAARVEAAVRRILEPIVGDLARTMIEAVAWEVIPDLAEAMIRAEIERVRQSTRTD